MDKKCIKCNKDKELINFFKSKKNNDGYAKKCKECYYGHEPKLFQRGQIRKCIRCKKDKIKEEFYLRKDVKHPHGRRSICIECCNLSSKIEKYKKYGLSKEEYESLLNMNNGKCHICNFESKTTYIDHCHLTNKVRGILCPSCNTAIGLFGDDILLMLKAIEYINKSK